MFFETILHLALIFFDLTNFTESRFNVIKNHSQSTLNTGSYVGLKDLLSLPKEIQNTIKSIFIQLMKLDQSKYYYFKIKLDEFYLVTTGYSDKLDQEKSKFADFDPENLNEDRYVVAEYFTKKSTCYYPYSPYYYLTICRSRVGPLHHLECYQKEISLVTIKDKTLKVYYERDQGGYDTQEWLLDGKKRDAIIDRLSCVQLVVGYNCFKYRENVYSSEMALPFQTICQTLDKNV